MSFIIFFNGFNFRLLRDSRFSTLHTFITIQRHCPLNNSIEKKRTGWIPHINLMYSKISSLMDQLCNGN